MEGNGGNRSEDRIKRGMGGERELGRNSIGSARNSGERARKSKTGMDVRVEDK